jgi:hypothetical protein
MAAQTVLSPVAADPTVRDSAAVYVEGLTVGLLGAATIALWFLALDTLAGRPLYTPTVLGTALFHGGRGLDSPGTLPISFETVVSFTWVHVLAFLLIGMGAAKLIDLAERNPSFGFGLVLMFVVFQYGFLQVSMILAEPVLHALAWPQVMAGNLMAALVMSVTLWRRHPKLVIEP